MMSIFGCLFFTVINKKDMSKVFVSYKRVDKDKVFPLVEQLENELGISFWVDLTCIESDEQFSNIIVNAINECEVFLFMYSKSHIIINPKKDWTVREITFADKKEKRIVFIDIEGINLPDWFAFRFPDQQVIKASDTRAMCKLVGDMRKWLRLPQPNSSPSNIAKTTDTSGSVSHPQIESTGVVKPHPQAIDLGLPSGTKWASCNVGAAKPEEYGGYFSWGETGEKDHYDWSTYKYCDGTKETCRNLLSDISGTEYDVAHMKWGGNWRMPTVEDFDELIGNCIIEWVNLNGVRGRKFTSEINGNSIFLPAAGYRGCRGRDCASWYGYYWSSAQHPLFYFHAYNFRLCFHSGYADMSHNGRGNGFSVRPVSKN